MQQAQEDKAKAKATYAQMKASIPAIAKQYGIGEDTAQLLLDNGKLDEFIMQAAKPKDLTTDQKNFAQAQAEGYKGDFNTWLTDDANRKAPKTTVNVDTAGAPEFAKALTKQETDAIAATPASAESITAVQNGRKALNSGIVAGSIASPATLEGRKIWAGVFGLTDQAANSTDEYIDAMKTQVLPKLKTLYPASDTDVKYLEGMTAATLTQHPEVLGRILDKIELGERKSIAKTNSAAQKMIDAQDDPKAKKAMQAAFDAVKTNAPAWDDAAVGKVNPDDIKELKKNPDAASKQEFDDIYGPGMADQILGAN
jgi:hypothetical protein